jgi:hypothetical protein
MTTRLARRQARAGKVPWLCENLGTALANGFPLCVPKTACLLWSLLASPFSADILRTAEWLIGVGRRGVANGAAAYEDGSALRRSVAS